MDAVKAYLEEKLQEMGRRLAHNEKLLSTLPKGSLSAKHIHNRLYLYYESYEKTEASGTSKKKTRMLRETDRMLITGIRKRVYLQKENKKLQKNVKALKKLLHNYQAWTDETIIDELPEIYRTGFDYRGFTEESCQEENSTGRFQKDHRNSTAKQPLHSETLFPEQLIHRNSIGERYRSKAEVQVSELLLNKGIPYWYEPQLKLKSGNVRSDFLMKHPASGRRAYLEYFGMMDDQKYAKKTALKMQQYLNSGFVAGKDVFFVFEAAATGMDLTVLIKTLDMFLTG